MKEFLGTLRRVTFKQLIGFVLKNNNLCTRQKKTFKPPLNYGIIFFQARLE